MRKTILFLSSLLLAVAVHAQSSSAALNIEVKIPSVFEITGFQSGTSRILDVRTNVKSFCVMFMNEQAQVRPVSYKGNSKTRHCFSFVGTQRLIFDEVNSTYSFMAGEQP